MSLAPNWLDTEQPKGPGSFESFDQKVVFGVDAGETLATEVAALGAERILLVSGRTLMANDGGIVSAVRRALGDRVVADQVVHAHSPYDDVLAGAEQARRAGVDLVVAVGGSSVGDAAKAIYLCLADNVTSVPELDARRVVLGADRDLTLNPPRNLHRPIAIPTTLSAGEFTSSAGLLHPTGVKASFRSASLAPQTVILDPRATLETPIDLLLSTGMRAVDHAVEGHLSRLANVVTRPISLTALRLLWTALPQIVQRSDDLEARLAAQIGMWQSVVPLGSGVLPGASHSIGHTLGALYGIPHGKTSCVLLSAVLRWNEQRPSDVQASLKSGLPSSVAAVSDQVRDLIVSLGQPASLREVGVGAADFDEIARQTLINRGRMLLLNDRIIESKDDILEILNLAF